MKRLPDTELEVMKALWASGPDTPRAALEAALGRFAAMAAELRVDMRCELRHAAGEIPVPPPDGPYKKRKRGKKYD